MWLLVVTIGVAATCRAGDPATGSNASPAAPTADETTAPDVAAPVTPRRYTHNHATRRLTVAQGIEESVQRLTRGLDLKPDQQERLREILMDQHRQMMRLRKGGFGASDDATGAMLSIYDQTRARIRALLTEEQLKKYPSAVPRDQTAAGQADLESWLKMQETKRNHESGT
jgi:hypothetical protein